MEEFYIIDSKERRSDCLKAISRLRAVPVMCVFVKEYKRERTGAQNRLYWQMVTLIAQDIGEDKEALHENLKARFLGMEERTILGRATVIAKSTRHLSVGEFKDYLEKVEALAASLGLILPTNDERNYAMKREPVEAEKPFDEPNRI